MTGPSIAFGEREGNAIRSANVCGRVELLGGSGEVAQSWEIRPGCWTLGAGSQNHIVLPEDPTIEDLHAVFTVGKKYTLVKAHGPIRIGERLIRECLIDRSTLMECGSYRLVIHPFGRTAISVVTHDQITDIASKLAKATVRLTPGQRPGPSPDTSARSRIDEQAATSELKGELGQLRSALDSIQSRIDRFPEIDNWNQRIEQLATQSITAIEAELGERIREPLREELLALCQEQQPQWTEELKSRIRSLESQIRQLEEQWERALLQTQEDLSRTNLRLVDLVEDQQSLRELVNQFAESFSDVRRNLTDSAPSSDSISYSADSDLGYVPGSVDRDQPDRDAMYEDPGPTDSRISEGDSESYEGRSYDDGTDQSLQEDPSSDSDEVFEFQVDDESISLRLNRMLGEHVERRPIQEPSEPSSLEPQNESPSFQIGGDWNLPKDHDNAVDQPFNASAPVDQDLSGGISISEIYAEADLQSKFTKPKTFESVLSEREESIRGDAQAKHPALDKQSEDNEGHASEEESIEEYMQRLLQRVRTGPGSADSSAIAKKEPAKGPSGRSADPSLRTNEANEVGASVKEQRKKNAAPTPKVPVKPIEEVKSDLAALRELANSNARRAITRSAIRRNSTKGLAKIALTAVSLICGTALFFVPGVSDNIKYGGIGVALIISLLWGYEALSEISAMLFQRKQRHEDHATEKEAKRGSKSFQRKGSSKG